jgi:hypothetical protein
VLNLDMGSVPDWLAGAGTLIAVVFAGWAARSAHSTNQAQSTQLRELQAEAESRAEQALREQAKHVSAWIMADLSVIYSNTSAEPAYHPYIAFKCGDAGAMHTLNVISPNTASATHGDMSTELQNLLYKTALQNIGQDPATFRGSVADAHRDEYVRERERLKTLWTRQGVSIGFRDAAGTMWIRDDNGILRQR